MNNLRKDEKKEIKNLWVSIVSLPCALEIFDYLLGEKVTTQQERKMLINVKSVEIKKRISSSWFIIAISTHIDYLGIYDSNSQKKQFQQQILQLGYITLFYQNVKTT